MPVLILCLKVFSNTSENLAAVIFLVLFFSLSIIMFVYLIIIELYGRMLISETKIIKKWCHIFEKKRTISINDIQELTITTDNKFIKIYAKLSFNKGKEIKLFVFGNIEENDKSKIYNFFELLRNEIIPSSNNT
ncbi:MAG: hypothetical protein GQ574_15830 [Crocinitomix sp.]|nr:hypothetical protein [Crocinitomix sp.]